MKLTIIDCARRFVLLKLTTERHEASRGLLATAELLVIEYFYAAGCSAGIVFNLSRCPVVRPLQT